VIMIKGTARFRRYLAVGSIVLAGLSLIGLLSGCSSANPAASGTSANGAAKLPMAQSSASSSPQVMSGGSAPTNSAPVSLAAGTPPVQEHLVGIGTATVVTIHGTIVKVNRAKKLVTLEGPQGKQVTLHVYDPYNLAAAKAGAPFVAKFYEIVTVRKKLPGESVPAASVAAGIVSAMPGQVPGAVAGTRREIVVTVDAIDIDAKTVAVKGPDGSVETIAVANASNLKYVKVGDQIVLTLSNVVAIALEKESGF
jgi:hypothetical protein